MVAVPARSARRFFRWTLAAFTAGVMLASCGGGRALSVPRTTANGHSATPANLALPVPPPPPAMTPAKPSSVGRHVSAAHASFFAGEAALSNGVYYLALPNGNPFGYYSYLADSNYIYHFDIGYLYVFDANDGQGGVYFYDFTSGHWWYTGRQYPFPYIYDFSLSSVLYYYPDSQNSGRYHTSPRDFYSFAASRTITLWSSPTTLFTNADFGGAQGPVGDVSTLQLADGRYRMYIGTTPANDGIHSAISSDGLHFTLESGIRLPRVYPGFVPPGYPSGAGSPCVVLLPNGNVRMYFTQSNNTTGPGVYSAISSDGLNFTFESGPRILASAFGETIINIGEHGIVQLPTGVWRMYVSNQKTYTVGQAQLSNDSIYSATSTDLVTWTRDPGIRVGPGSTIANDSSEQSAVKNADGTITLMYWRSSPYGMWASTSSDGLTFTSEEAMGLRGNGPDVIPFGSGVINYYNEGNDTYGTINASTHEAF